MSYNLESRNGNIMRRVLHGDIAFTSTPKNFDLYEDSYLIIEQGKVADITVEKPEISGDDIFEDYKGKLIIPGMSDLHMHAPQYSFCGLGMDLELLEWLDTYTFPEEKKYKDLDYAKKAYEIFVNDLKKTTTTRVVVFSTIHVEATYLLMQMLEEAGFLGYVGKVNMNRNASPELTESTEESLEATIRWIEESRKKFKNIKPIITPRFTVSCTDDLMEGLGQISKEYNVAVQSHLSENLDEIKFVKEICEWSDSYGQTYDRPGLLGDKDHPAIMAHCVYSLKNENELNLLKDKKTFIAHCPQSNMNLSSGIAPIREYLNRNMNVGLGSDVAAGANIDIRRAIVDAIGVSKLYRRCIDNNCKPLSIKEGFYIATKLGGSYFGKVGSFEKGYEFDAVVIDDSNLKRPTDSILEERVERMIYFSDDRNVVHKYVGGRKMF